MNTFSSDILLYASFPLIGAIIGWCTNYLAVKMIFRPYKPISFLGLKIHGLIPRRQSDLARSIGETIELKLFRDGIEETVPVTIQPVDIDKINGGVIHPQLQGAIIGEMREQRLQRGRVDYLQILDVEKSSRAWEAGFRRGDIIYSSNKQLTRNFDEAFDLAETASRRMIMNIQRGNRELYILLK